MIFSKKSVLGLLCFGLLALCLCPPVSAVAEVPTFTVGWSVYAGWNPYFYMQKSGILKKWADKYGIAIKVQRFDYAASLDSFVAKNIDACTMTNMEALDMPAAAGVDSTVVIVGDYSNGNDAVLVRNGLTFDKLSGQPDHAGPEDGLGVSARARHGAQQPAGSTPQAAPDQHLRFRHRSRVPEQASNQAVVTWKPLVSQILVDKGVHSIFDSSKIPGEILDLLVVRTEVLNRPDGSGAEVRQGRQRRLVRDHAEAQGSGPAQTTGPQDQRRSLGRLGRLLQRAVEDHLSLRRPQSRG